MGFSYIVKEKMKQEAALSGDRKGGLGKFILLLFFLAAYLMLVTREYGLGDGIIITAITWSFFVLCTPVADAGFLVDYPVRLLMNFRMLRTEMLVWSTAALINIYSVFMMPGIYEANILLQVFYHILVTPYPYWAIIALSTLGTFLSINFGDEVVDAMSYSRERHIVNLKHDLVVFVVILVVVLFLYNLLLEELGITIV